MRYAWEGNRRGIWILLTDIEDEGARTWIDRDTALSELAGEGWTITRPYPKRKRKEGDSGRGFQGFALTRTIH